MSFQDAIDRFNAEHDIVTLLNVELRKTSMSNGGQLSGPCPVCMDGTDRLSVYPNDSRGPRAICRVCNLGGDSVFWSILLDGGNPKEKGVTGRYLRDRGYLSPSSPAKRKATSKRSAKLAPTVSATKRIDPKRVQAIWSNLTPMLNVPEVAAYLRSRGIDPVTSEDADLARAIPPKGPKLPHELHCGGTSWRATAHALVVSMFDHDGNRAGLHARAIGNAENKTLNPIGQSPIGLVFADSAGVELLKGSPVNDRVLIAEGLTDWLAWSCHWGVDGRIERAPAILGVVSGSWREDSQLAKRIPRGFTVTICTDDDEAGERYAAKIARSLPRGVVVERGRVRGF